MNGKKGSGTFLFDGKKGSGTFLFETRFDKFNLTEKRGQVPFFLELDLISSTYAKTTATD